jgi:hypothetical protein
MEEVVVDLYNYMLNKYMEKGVFYLKEVVLLMIVKLRVKVVLVLVVV